MKGGKKLCIHKISNNQEQNCVQYLNLTSLFTRFPEMDPFHDS